jgi:2-polyprenyl-3-methyl-5-hydroxy-6-metoxy-1,4-benzoquinol methylase
MTATDTVSAPASDVDPSLVQSFAMKVAGDHAVASNGALAYLGDRLGLWRALASTASTTSTELAEQTGLSERYLREWLSAQAAVGYVHYDPQTRRFTFPAEHAAVLADDDSPAALAGLYEVTAAIWAGTDRLAHAFATGEGVGWQDQDPRLVTGVERFFRPLYANSLVTEWLPAVPGLVERLQRGVRVLDVGAGLGTATRMMAQAFPASTFVGVDNHEDSIRRATHAADRSGLSNVTFSTAGATDYSGEAYDVICFFDTLHDLGDPVGALRHARASLATDGIVFAVEPGAGDQLENNLHPLGLAWYSVSTSICLPGSLSQHGQAGLGAQAGPTRMLEVFAEAGFDVSRLVATTPFSLVYEARD